MKELIFHGVTKIWYSKKDQVYVLTSRFGKNREVDGFLDKVEASRAGQMSVTLSVPEEHTQTVTSSSPSEPEPITEEDLTLLEASEPVFEHDPHDGHQESSLLDSMIGGLKGETKPE